MRDSRLIGTWRSDRRRTAKEIAARADISAGNKAKLQRFFGKLELRYTPSRCYTRLGEDLFVSRYSVVAKDTSSAAVVTFSPAAGKRIVHVHFQGDGYYWITLGSSGNREFFRRVSSRKKR